MCRTPGRLARASRSPTSSSTRARLARSRQLALTAQKESPQKDLGKLLLTLGFISGADLAQAQAQRLGLEYVELTVEPQFNHIFTQSLIFPHGEDTFPSLEHILAGADKK